MYPLQNQFSAFAASRHQFCSCNALQCKPYCRLQVNECCRCMTAQTRAAGSCTPTESVQSTSYQPQSSLTPSQEQSSGSSLASLSLRGDSQQQIMLNRFNILLVIATACDLGTACGAIFYDCIELLISYSSACSVHAPPCTSTVGCACLVSVCPCCCLDLCT